MLAEVTLTSDRSQKQKKHLVTSSVVSKANELAAVAKVIRANKAAEIAHRRTRPARLHEVHHLFSFFLSLCARSFNSGTLFCVLLNMLPLLTLVSLEWMHCWIMALIHSRARPVWDDEGKRMVISRCRKWKGGSSADIQIADRDFFSPFDKSSRRAPDAGGKWCLEISYHLVIPAVVAGIRCCTPNSSRDPARPYAYAKDKTRWIKLVFTSTCLCKSMQTENTTYAIMCTTSPRL